MPQPLRKVRQRIPKAEIRPPRVLLHLPFLGVAALLVVFAVAVGWAFFMGVIIGQGQNPAERVNALLHERPRETPPVTVEDDGESVADLLDRPLPLRKDAPDAGAEAAGGSDGAAAPSPDRPAQPGEQGGQAAPAQEAQGKDAHGQTAQAASEQPQAPAYPFARPQGESLAAWGIQPSAPQGAQQAAPQDRAKAQPAGTDRAGQKAEAKTEQKPAAKAEPKFDYVYQAAAFRDKGDGDALRARLEEKGLRTRLQKSGKVYLVQVLLRGSEREAENVRETLRRMGLGKPIRLSKKAVK